MDDDGLLAEQRAYYRARAPEYDEWWQRRGRYDRGSDLAEEWDRQVDEGTIGHVGLSESAALVSAGLGLVWAIAGLLGML